MARRRLTRLPHSYPAGKKAASLLLQRAHQRRHANFEIGERFDLARARAVDRLVVDLEADLLSSNRLERE
jgi:hypothetical protein